MQTFIAQPAAAHAFCAFPRTKPNMVKMVIPFAGFTLNGCQQLTKVNQHKTINYFTGLLKCVTSMLLLRKEEKQHY